MICSFAEIWFPFIPYLYPLCNETNDWLNVYHTNDILCYNGCRKYPHMDFFSRFTYYLPWIVFFTVSPSLPPLSLILPLSFFTKIFSHYAAFLRQTDFNSLFVPRYSVCDKPVYGKPEYNWKRIMQTLHIDNICMWFQMECVCVWVDWM